MLQSKLISFQMVFEAQKFVKTNFVNFKIHLECDELVKVEHWGIVLSLLSGGLSNYDFVISRTLDVTRCLKF